MFDRLFEIFNKISPEQPREPVYRESVEAPVSVSTPTDNSGTMIGYDYLNKEENGEEQPQRFLRLSEFLRGRYK